MTEKECAKCGKRFEAKSQAQKYCGKFCSKLAHSERVAANARCKAEQRRESRKPMYCEKCGIELPIGCRSSRKYCDECRKEVAKASKEQRKLGGHHNRKLRPFVCQMCNTASEAYGSAKYCEDCKKRKQRNMNIEFIGKRDGREVFHKVCAECGLPFNTFSEDRDTCTPCVKGTAVKKQAVKPPVLSLAEQMRVIAQYNRDHGTDYQYGQYDTVQRLMRGELRVEVKL